MKRPWPAFWRSSEATKAVFIVIKKHCENCLAGIMQDDLCLMNNLKKMFRGGDVLRFMFSTAETARRCWACPNSGSGRTLICLDSMRVLTVPRPNLHFFHQVAMSWGRRNNENVEIMIHPDYQYFLDATRRKVGRTSHNVMKREYVWRHDYFIFILRHLSGISSSSSMASQRAFRVVSITTIARNNPIYPKYYAYSRVLSAT